MGKLFQRFDLKHMFLRVDQNIGFTTMDVGDTYTSKQVTNVEAQQLLEEERRY